MPKIAIVGAGAMGVVSGYYLQHAGAEITYLVRPSRVAEIPAEYRLYSYDDGTVQRFSGYDVIGDPADLAHNRYDFVILALDHRSVTSSDGQVLLTAIGAAIRDTDAVLIVGAVSVSGLRDAVIKTSQLPDERVIMGMVAIAIHKTEGVSFPLNAPTDPEKLASADFAFRHPSPAGFFIEDRFAEVTKRFVELYDRNGLDKCFTLPPEQFDMMTSNIFPIYLAGELSGWPDTDGMEANTEVWSLAAESVRSIHGLSIHGESGQAAAAALTPENLAKSWKDFEKMILPLDYAAFNAYHHGGKVRAADRLILDTYVAIGDREGRDMSALKELLSRVS